MKAFHFIAGLPHSGAELLADILAQNPAIHAPKDGCLLPTLHGALNGLAASDLVATRPRAVLQAVMAGVYAHAPEPVVVDAHLGWAAPPNLQMLGVALDRKPRVICMVRAVEDVLAAWLSNPGDDTLTEAARVKQLMDPGGAVKLPWDWLKQASAEWRDCLLFVDYDDFIKAPARELKRIHAFLGLADHRYDLTYVPRPGKRIDARKMLGELDWRTYRIGNFWSAKPLASLPPHPIDIEVATALRGDFDKSWAMLQAMDWSDNKIAFNVGWHLMRHGQLSEAYRMLDRGRGELTWGHPSESRMPIYDGRPLQGETVLLEMECGHGDEIFATRFAREIAARGGKAVVKAKLELAGILSRAPGVSAVVQHGAGGAILHHYRMFGMSAAAALGMEYADVDGSPYLPCAPRPPGPRPLRVGIRWRGDPLMSHDKYRQFDPAILWDLPGVRLVSLQRDVDPATIPPHIEQPSLARWEDTVAAIESCDLVVSSCTSVAHLAAAMGRPTWVLVPVLPYYTWALPGDRSPWYDSVRLFRQSAYMEWSDMESRLHDALAGFVAESQPRELVA